MTQRVPLKDKVLQALSEGYPNEIRFSELYEQVGSPSRSVFTEVLKALGEAKLITRNEISYRYVTYRLDLVEFQKKLQADKEKIDEVTRKLDQKR
jgi:DNA-binding HxlR family transcriptional regulator